MVAKLMALGAEERDCLNLAKIHMVAKPRIVIVSSPYCLNLAKIHMVAKHLLA